jgi:HAUS augmin-like complex subunit 1
VLTRAGYTPEISHGTLLEAAQKHQQLVRETQPVLETLRSYQDLPPDKALAELAIEEKRRQLEATERRLEDAISGMAVR